MLLTVNQDARSGHRHRWWLAIPLLIAVVLPLPRPACGEVDPGMGAQMATLTPPVQAAIAGVNEGLVEMTIGEAPLETGVRLTVYRRGAPFRHPLTGEELGRLESPVGRVEVVARRNDRAEARIISGDAAPGDVARLTAAPLKVLLTHAPGTNQALLDQLFQTFREQKRFEFRDGGPVPNPRTAAPSLVAGEDLVLHIEVARDTARGLLLWAEDGTLWRTLDMPLSRSPRTSSPVPAGTGVAAEAGMPFPAAAPGTPLPHIHFKLPHKGYLLATGDLDGDGNAELLVHEGNRLHVYRPERLEVRPVGEIRVGKAGEPFSMGVADLNGNGRDEVFITGITDVGPRDGGTTGDNTDDVREVRPVVTVIEYDGTGAYRTLWSDENVFVRVLDGNVYAQDFSASDGARGAILDLVFAEGGYRAGDESHDVPAGVDLFDLVPVGDRWGVYTADDRLALLDASGAQLWRTEIFFGGSRFSYTKRAGPYSLAERKTKNLPPVADAAGRIIFVPRNNAISSVLKSSIGFRSSEVLPLDAATGEPLGQGEDQSFLAELRDVTRLPDGRVAALLAPILGGSSELFTRWDYFLGKSVLLLIDPARL